MVSALLFLGVGWMGPGTRSAVPARVLNELDGLRSTADLPSREEIAARSRQVQPPPRPAFVPRLWPRELPGIGWDYAWRDRDGLASTQAIVYARHGRGAPPRVNWATDPHVDLLMLTGHWNYLDPGMEELARQSMATVDWRPGESVLDVGAGPGVFAFGLAARMRREGKGTERLYAEEVNPGFLRFWRYALERLDWREGEPLTPILGATDDVRTPPRRVDKVLLAHVWYWAVDNQPTGPGRLAPRRFRDEDVRRQGGPLFASIDRALKPGGAVYFVTWRWSHGSEQVDDQVRRVLGYRNYRVTRVQVLESHPGEGGGGDHLSVTLTKDPEPDGPSSKFLPAQAARYSARASLTRSAPSPGAP